LRQVPAPLPGRGFFMAPAIELVQVSQGAIKTQAVRQRRTAGA